MKSFKDSKSRVLTFMEDVQEGLERDAANVAFQNTYAYKSKELEKCKDKARDFCLDGVLRSIYKDAIPLNDEYKQANDTEIDDFYTDFMNRRMDGNKLQFYVREAIKKNNSEFARKVMEAVDQLVNDEYRDKEMDLAKIDPRDLIFQSTDDIQQKVDIIGKDLSTDEVSQIVKDNVKSTALSEITRAKKEKENLKTVEDELSNDINMNTQQAVESALEFRGLNSSKIFSPTLFQGVMISKVNQLEPKFESGEIGDIYLYGALSGFGKEDVQTEATDEMKFATMEELAFVESVKEYTGLSMLKALKLENFSKDTVKDLANQYASM